MKGSQGGMEDRKWRKRGDKGKKEILKKKSEGG